MTKVLFVAAEAVPFIKTGGLGDVIGSLPKELVKQGVDVRVVLPLYRDIAREYLDELEVVHRLEVPVGWRRQACGIARLKHEGVIFYFLENDYYFDRSGVYGYPDDDERFAFFCRAVLEALPYLEFQPDILHCHDWHAGMVSVLLKAHYAEQDFYSGIKTVFTIHNLAYQGNFAPDILGDLLDLDWSYFTPEGVEACGQVSFLKGALNSADHLTTVSKSYAEEILTPEYGQRMDGLLRKRSGQLTGINNGIDYREYDPRKGTLIYTPFDARSLRRRRENKRQLQRELRLEDMPDSPLIGVVARLVDAKGIDLIAEALPGIISLNAQLAVLGTGEERYQQFFEEASLRYPGRIAASIGFDNRLAHSIYAGSDMFLMPSRYEPCGLSQLNALRYGSIPVVHATGGLKDTVQPYNGVAGEGTGFIFTEYTPESLLETMREAVAVYHDPKAWNNLIRSAMKRDLSWHQPAGRYKSLYGQLLAK